MRIRTLIFLLAHLLALSTAVANTDTPFSFSSFVDTQRKDVALCATEPSSILSLTLREHALIEALRTSHQLTLTDFPLDPSMTGVVQLQRVRSVVDQNTIIVSPAVTKGEQSTPEVHSFSGSIQGEPGSIVRLTDIGGTLFVLIERSNGKSFILAPSADSYENRHYTMMASSAIRADMRNLWEHLPTGDGSNKTMPVPQSLDWSRLLETDLALETDTEFFIATGRDSKLAQAYAIALVQMMSLVYTEQVNVCFRLSWLKTWTDAPADPYGVKGDAYALPDKVRLYWKENYRDVPRDVAHVMTSVSYGGGGFGYYNALCSKGDYAFSVSSVQGRSRYPTFAFTYDIYILAHELGHNFNAHHTHSCAAGFPLDTCLTEEAVRDGCLDASATPKPNPGSIMSYCGGTNNAAGLGYSVRMTFLDFNKNEIRTAAEAAACLQAPELPTLALTSLRGGDQFTPLQRVDVTWRSSSVASVNVDYTTDGMNWSRAATSIPATDGLYSLSVPDVCTRNFSVRIADGGGGTARDSSVLQNVIIKNDPDGLVAFYPFETSLNDEQECHFYHLQGQATYTSDRFGVTNNAAQFNGSTSVRNDGFPMSYPAFSYSFWFRPATLSDEQHLLGTNWEEGPAVLQTFVWGQFGMAYWSGGGSPRQLWGGSPSINVWNHGAITCDGTTISLYLNGQMRAQETLAAPIARSERAKFYAGGRGNKAFYTGGLDDVRYYQRSLSASDVSDLYTSKPLSVDDDHQGVTSTAVFPNPTQDQITIAFTQPLTILTTVHITNALGVIVRSFTAAPKAMHLTIDLSDLPSGSYRVRVPSQDAIQTHPVTLIR